MLPFVCLFRFLLVLQCHTHSLTVTKQTVLTARGHVVWCGVVCSVGRLKAGRKELALLREVRSKDSRGASFCIRMFCDFMLGKHMCIAFEAEEMNLRQVIKKFGKDVGINLAAVQR